MFCMLKFVANSLLTLRRFVTKRIDMESDVPINLNLDFTRILLGIDITKQKPILFVDTLIDLMNKDVQD